MNIFKQKTEVELLQLFENKELQLDQAIALVHVQNGYGKFDKVITHESDSATYSILFDNKALLSLHCDEYYCPTCTKIIEAGYGLQDITNQIVESIKFGEEVDNISECVELIKPVLKLFSTGLYAVSKLKLIPTDGEGNFFWTERDTCKLSGATTNYLFKPDFFEAFPKFICSSQPLSRINYDCVEKYRNDIRNGKTLGGLAYYVDGYICILLDGHHRATACCLENSELEVLTIMDVSSYLDHEKNLNISVANRRININNGHLVKKIRRILKQKDKNSRKSVAIEKPVMKQGYKVNQTLWNELEIASRRYPDYILASLENRFTNLSAERIYELWNETDEESSFEVEVLIKSLYCRSPEILLPILIKMIKNHKFSERKDIIYQYLYYYNSNEVESIFTEYLIDNMFDKHDHISKLAEDYLKNRL